jgi:tetratricopeptide (TPR) repeat protein
MMRLLRTSVILLLAATALALWCAGCKAPQPTPDKQEETSIRAHDLVVEADESLEAGNDDEALRLLAAAIEDNPTLTVAHMKMADIYRLRGDYDKAEQAYANAAQLEPRNFDAQYYHGLTLHFLNRLAEAIRVYLKALAIRPDDFNANLNIATAYFQLGESREALDYAENAVRIDPASGPARANLGAVYAALGRYDDAVRQYQSASELMTLSPELLLNLAESLGKTGRYQEMEITLQAVVDMQETAAAWERIGYARFKQRNYPGAIEAFRKAIDLDPRHYPALNGLGVCLLNRYLTSDREDVAARDEALRLLRQSLRINNRQPQIIDLVSRFGGS